MKHSRSSAKGAEKIMVGKTKMTLNFPDGRKHSIEPSREFTNPLINPDNPHDHRRMPGQKLSEWKELANSLAKGERYSGFELN